MSGASASKFRELETLLRKFIAAAAERTTIETEDDAEMAKINRCAHSITTAEEAAWTEFQRRVERADQPSVPRQVTALADQVAAYLALSCETFKAGSTPKLAIGFDEHRARIVAEGPKVLDLIAKCEDFSQQREEKDAAWRQRRLDFIDQLYTSEHTRSLMDAFDRLESTMGGEFDKNHDNLPSAKVLLTRTLARVLFWCRDQKRPFIFSSLPLDAYKPLYGFEAMREEWKAAKSSRKKNAA